MLLQLKVSNYALIDSLNLNLGEGFTAITGETGSGKSIMLGALGLVLGERADVKSLRNKDAKCIVEATFRLNRKRFGSFFTEHDLDFEEESVLRREINKSGKSRAFINDTPVTLVQLKELTSQLIDIHSQHQTLLIKRSDFQMSVLDSFSGNHKQLDAYSDAYAAFKKAEAHLNHLQEQNARAQSDFDYKQFQFNELSALSLEELDLVSMEKELELLSNAEELKEIASQLNELLNSDGGVLDQLSTVRGQAQKLADISNSFQSSSERMSSVTIELNDIAQETAELANGLEHDPQRIELLSEQINELNRLLVKHHVDSVDRLVEIRNELDHSLQVTASLDEQIAKSRSELEAARKLVMDKGRLLSESRKNSIVELQKKLKELLSLLSMPHAEFHFDLNSGIDITANGLDQLKVMVKLNKGSQFLPIEKAASGGELSRIMLALKAILSTGVSIPTIIFDEIDTGVSGEVANKMGDMMLKIAKGMQVLGITHLPQIAAKASQHFKVFKETEADSTSTYINLLNQDQRLLEIAEMLSGKNPGEAAVANARELLN